MLYEKYLALGKYSVHVYWPELIVLLLQFPNLREQNGLSALGISV